MKVFFQSAQTLGNQFYKKGEHAVPGHLAYNISFKQLVKSGAVYVLPKDSAAQKIQLSRDIQAHQKAKASRLATKASKSAQAASSAPQSLLSSAAEPVQAAKQPAQPISTGAKAPVSAQTKKGVE